MTAKPKRSAKKKSVPLNDCKVLRGLWLRRIEFKGRFGRGKVAYILDFGAPGGTKGCRPASDVEVRLIRALRDKP